VRPGVVLAIAVSRRTDLSLGNQLPGVMLVCCTTGNSRSNEE
jgi:hypothetical protein